MTDVSTAIFGLLGVLLFLAVPSAFVLRAAVRGNFGARLSVLIGGGGLVVMVGGAVGEVDLAAMSASQACIGIVSVWSVFLYGGAAVYGSLRFLRFIGGALIARFWPRQQA